MTPVLDSADSSGTQPAATESDPLQPWDAGQQPAPSSDWREGLEPRIFDVLEQLNELLADVERGD